MTLTPDSQPVAERPWEQPFAAAWTEDDSLLAIAGAVEERDATELRELIRAHSQDGTRRLVIDLSEVQLLPSSAVGVLAVAVARSSAPVELVAKTGCIAQRVLRICGLPYTTGDAGASDTAEAEPAS